jgi:chemotaxis protein methyltransferase CheR
MIKDSYETFKDKILALTKIDLDFYKEKQMKRRIDALVEKHHFDSYTSFVEGIKKDKILFDEFVGYLTINVSEFWRNPEQWNIALEKDVIPDLLKRNPMGLKIWSAACSTGDEPYSLVMLLTKFMPMTKIKIIATDLDKAILDKAKSGVYNVKSLKGLPKEFQKKFFSEINATTFQINPEVKKCVEFKQHNLLKDPYISNCDLIVCRNVMIYFTEEAKVDIYKNFSKSLKKDGVLFIGSTEQIIGPQNVGFEPLRSFFYRKVEGVV